MPRIDTIRTGVPGLDDVLGGGLPTLSFNVLGGDPGAGKTTLAHQIVFANATEERPALFCTVVGEPPVKMLRYQQQFDFFDPGKVGKAIHYQNLTDEALDADLDGILSAIRSEMERLEPAFVVVDSFRSVSRHALRGGRDEGRARNFENFVQRLSIEMTRWEATTFLLGEFDTGEGADNPIFTIADGILWLRHVRELDTRVRKLEVAKLRGRSELPGQHVYRITTRGLRIYPRELPGLAELDDGGSAGRIRTGVQGLDEMMSGGFVRGDAVIVSGPSGTGKSLLCMQFVNAGLEAGENVVVATFEESNRKYESRAEQLGFDFDGAKAEGRMRLIHRRPLDLSIDETFEEMRDLVEEIGATRLVIDSLSGLQVAASGAQAERLRQSMGRTVHTLTEAGLTVLMSAELNQQVDVLRFTPHESSFLADDIILQRYVEIRGQLETVMSVVKMRRSDHSRSFHRYDITEGGIVVGERLDNLRGILSGVPEMTE